MLADGQSPQGRPDPVPPSEFPEFDAWILRAFGHLSTCRPGGFGILPIPWTAIVQYADRERMTPDVVEMFVACVSAVDRAFLADERAKEAAKHPPAAR